MVSPHQFFPIFQTNVYPSAQKRKARPFEGFQRRAVVVVPNDETYKERVAAQAAAGNKDIPDEAIMEMKGIVYNHFPSKCTFKEYHDNVMRHLSSQLWSQKRS